MVSLCPVILSIGVLVIPSMEHRLVESGRSTNRLVRATNAYAGLGLVPLMASFGSFDLRRDRLPFWHSSGASGLVLACVAAFAWFGLELSIGPSGASK
jgi:hypothetical protein